MRIGSWTSFLTGPVLPRSSRNNSISPLKETRLLDRSGRASEPLSLGMSVQVQDGGLDVGSDEEYGDEVFPFLPQQTPLSIDIGIENGEGDSPPTPWGSRKTAPSRSQGISREPFVPKPGTPMYYRMKYYGGLSSKSYLHTASDENGPEPLSFEPPTSVVESVAVFTLAGAVDVSSKRGKQRSYQTIFSIYATLLGSGLLSLPWGFQSGGVFVSLFTTLCLGVISYYTAVLVLRHSAALDMGGFEGVVKFYLGRPGFFVTLFASILVFVGVLFAFTVFISQGLYNLVCIIPAAADSSYWTPELAMFPLLYFLFPLCILENFGIFVKMSAFGVISAFAVIVSVVGLSIPNVRAPDHGWFELKASVASLAGLLAVGFFNHNAIVSLMKNQKNPKNNNRDALIAFSLTGVTYAGVGLIGFLGNQDISISQNFLDSFGNDSALAILGRIAILAQQLVVFPLLLSFVRIQVFTFLTGRAYPSVFAVGALNTVVFAGCVLTGMFYRHVGDILRFVGAFVGCLYVFSLPPMVQMMSQWIKLVKNVKGNEESGKRLLLRLILVIASAAVNGVIPILGIVLFVFQFLPQSLFQKS